MRRSAPRFNSASEVGPRHLARACRTPCVVVAGPTDPRHCALSARERLVRDVVACGPCHRERCGLAGADEHRCMRALDPARIAAATLELARPIHQTSAATS
jgi:ADP-heptose:LPS heptosyltransferase